jgi:hypothetical protein
MFGYSFAWLLEGTPEYERRHEFDAKLERPQGSSEKDLVRTYESSGILELDRNVLSFTSGSEPSIHRFAPSFPLIRLDRCWLAFRCTRPLAEQIIAITVHANGYELLALNKSDWQIESATAEGFNLPKEAADLSPESEVAVLRPNSHNSTFAIDLIHNTPRRYNWPAS